MKEKIKYKDLFGKYGYPQEGCMDNDADECFTLTPCKQCAIFRKYAHEMIEREKNNYV
jgi:hypothetical protein